MWRCVVLLVSSLSNATNMWRFALREGCPGVDLVDDEAEPGARLGNRRRSRIQLE